jgi:hypothetical protein
VLFRARRALLPSFRNGVVSHRQILCHALSGRQVERLYESRLTAPRGGLDQW